MGGYGQTKKQQIQIINTSNIKKMSTTNSLKSIFANGKEELAQQLKNFRLPKDAEKIQNIVDSYLKNLFENDGQFRQNLTESEDYILLSALQILKSQQEITSEISKSITESVSDNSSNKSNKNKKDIIINPYITMAGSGVGAIVGGLAGTWGAALGSIAGTAIAIYLSTRYPSGSANQSSHGSNDEMINVEVYIDIVEKICESLDNVIETYRVQVKKVKNSYERREKPSLLNEYSALTSQVANVCKVTLFLSDTVPNKLVQAVEMMKDSLENYDLKYENGEIITNNQQ